MTENEITEELERDEPHRLLIEGLSGMQKMTTVIKEQHIIESINMAYYNIKGLLKDYLEPKEEDNHE